MIQAVFFDMGNTLLHYHEGPLSDEEKDFLGLAAMSEKLREWGFPISFEKLRDSFYLPWLELFPQRKKAAREFDVVEALGRAVPVQVLGAEQIRELFLAFHEPSASRVVTDPGSVEIFAELKSRGLKLGMISNSSLPGYCHDLSLQLSGLLPYLDFRLYSYDEGIRKPDARVFEKALRLAGASASEAVMVGDSSELDLEPASRLGMSVIPYRGSFALPTERVLGVAQTLADVREIVFKKR